MGDKVQSSGVWQSPPWVCCPTCDRFYLQIKRAHWHAPSQGHLKQHYLNSLLKFSVQTPPCARAIPRARIWLVGKYRNQQQQKPASIVYTLFQKKISWLVPSLELDLFISYNTWLILSLEVLWGYWDKVHSTRNHQYSRKDRCLELELFTLPLRSSIPSEQKPSISEGCVYIPRHVS